MKADMDGVTTLEIHGHNVRTGRKRKVNLHRKADGWLQVVDDGSPWGGAASFLPWWLSTLVDFAMWLQGWALSRAYTHGVER